MKKLSLISLLLLAACANDPHGGGVLGGAIGGATGAAVGYEMGGRDGAILGGAIGGATGAAVGQSQSGSVQQPARAEGGRNVHYDNSDGEKHRRKHKHDDHED